MCLDTSEKKFRPTLFYNLKKVIFGRLKKKTAKIKFEFNYK